MRTKKLLYYLIIFPLFLIFFSCKKESSSQVDLDLVEQTTDTVSENAVLGYIDELGFDVSKIKKVGDEYLIDDDILLSRKDIIQALSAKSKKKSVPTTSQYGTSNYVWLFKSVIIKVDPSMNSYINEINAAVDEWNNIPNTRLKFVIHSGAGVPYAPPNVTITNADLEPGVCGTAYFPMNGSPGSLVRINLNVISMNSFDQRKRTIAHELGHTIGLRHTDWFDPSKGPIEGGSGKATDTNNAYYNASHIIGTPTGTDPLSLMNRRECGIGSTTLSNYDKIAFSYIYPENPPVEGSVPVYRYYNVSNGDHMYTTSYGELVFGSNEGYIFEGIGFFAYDTQVPGTVPIYRYYSSNIGDHYFTTINGTFGGYVKEKIAFYAYPNAVNGAHAVNGYYNGKDHFYTKNPNEFFHGSQGYSFELVAFYAH